MQLPIHNTFGPLATSSQIRQAAWLHLTPWRWKHGQSIEIFRSSIAQKFTRNCALFSTGREALYTCLEALSLSTGDEVILQAYTCAVIPNAITCAGGTPVYCDIDADTLNSTPQELAKKITSKTKVVIVQHTFGIPADMPKIREVCDQHNLTLIEDCAHSIPTASEAGTIGHYGDIILLSFGRDKAISGVTGGAVLTNNTNIYAYISRKEAQASSLSFWKISMLLDYPIRYAFAKTLWKFKIGKLYLKFLALTKLLPPIYTAQEREGIMSKSVHSLPNACAILALKQWYRLGALNAHRRKLAQVYQAQLHTKALHICSGIQESTAPQKFPIIIHNRDIILELLKKKQIYIQDGWCGAAVNPPSVAQHLFQYVQGSCPVAESVAQKVLTLPVHPTMTEKQVIYLCQKLKDTLANQGYNSL